MLSRTAEHPAKEIVLSAQSHRTQGRRKKSILLVRLALFCVMVHGFGPNLAVVGPKLNPTCFFAAVSSTLQDASCIINSDCSSNRILP
jgi:hypothetical protein